MMILVHGIRLPLNSLPQQAVEAALRKAKLAQQQVQHTAIHKVSVDARRGNPMLVYSVAIEVQASNYKPPNIQDIRIAQEAEISLQPGKQELPGPIVVCGLGPAGLFAALELALMGYNPLVLERGPQLSERIAAVEHFEQSGVLQSEANIQFGEGGAGTFSDGKLTTRIGDALCSRVMQHLLSAGAPEEIALKSHPHIGTDKLRDVISGLRLRIEQAGGSIAFGTKLSGIEVRNGRIAAVTTNGEAQLPCGLLIFAGGHSARDTFEMLHASGLSLEAKGFSVGVRIEHLQQTIDEGLYHEAAGHPALPPGEYRLAARCGTKGVYTFCMCPGGSVVAAASEEGGAVTNGMSLHARNGKNANAAVVVGVSSEDFGGNPFKAIEFQRKLEKAAFAAGGGGYIAPAETQRSFMQGDGQLKLDRVQPSYPRGVKATNVGSLLPADITEALRQGLSVFGRKLPGFDAPDAVITGLETRTSSPVRLERNEQCESVSLQGLYPCGEGAGYAGGIMSAAVDGIRVAHAIIRRYSPK